MDRAATWSTLALGELVDDALGELIDDAIGELVEESPRRNCRRGPR